MVDGLWGEHEWMLYPQPYCHKSPYLTWLQLPSKNTASNTLTCPVHKRMWQAHLNKQNLHLVNPTEFHEFKNKLEEVKAAVMNPFHKVIVNSCFSHIHPPNNAYAQAFEALDHLGKEFGAWCDFIKVVRGLQHNLLKLFAFADWWHDVQQGDNF
jgi:hypothetical protein